ncbi:MAG: acyl-CoA dehydratase activase-related protein [Desulfobacterales bacterium]|nr:acyl-CoA dehydratase activase-related protein [Desulfobacterales bacterium]
MKIGIPRALGYYNYYPFWFGFFTDLGIEPVLSGKTTKKIVSQGSALVVSETCLPVKIYIGHVIDLLNKGVDVIYSPSIQSIAPKIYNCSKLRGLPDLVRNVVKREFLLIEPTLDKSVPKQGLYEYLYESVAPLGITDKKKIKKASKAGWECMNKYNLMIRAGMPVDDALKHAIKGQVIIEKDNSDKPINVAVVSHGYNLYDNQVSMNMFEKLGTLGAKAYTPENLTTEQMKQGLKVLNTNLYWANEYEMSGAAGHFLKDNKIDGIITLTAFGCGPDSLMIERHYQIRKKYRKPLLNLTIDEHTGEAGFVTRLEAFTDMLYRKKRSTLVEKLNKQIYKEDDEETRKIKEEFERLQSKV